MTLDLTLKGAAILLLALSGYEYVYKSMVPLGPVIVANVIFVTSIFSRKQPYRVALIALALAVIVPAGAFRAYAKGDATLMAAILNLPIFAYVAYIALQTRRDHRGKSEADDASGTTE